MKNVLIGLVVFILLILGVTYVVNTEENTSPQPNTPTDEEPRSDEQPNEEPTARSIPADHRLQAEPQLGYSLAIPYTVDVSSPQDGIVRYRYVGPESEPDTEITDGYTVTVTARTQTATSVETLAAQEIQGQRNTVLEVPSSNQLAGQPVQQYTTESELGDKPIEHTVFIPGNGFEYIVSVNITPYENNTYREEIYSFLDTLRFHDKTAAESFSARTVPIAMLDYAAVGNQYVRESSGFERGCDRVVLTQHILDAPTQAVLNSSLEQLFAYERETVGGWQNFIASQTSLEFDRAEIEDDTARIYLTGELGPLAGVCDNPRAAIQIEETALAYDSVDSVELFLNGEATTLTPDGRGE